MNGLRLLPKLPNQLGLLVLVGLAFWVYGQTANFEYVNYDDPFVVAENELVQGASWDHFVEIVGAPHDNAYLPIYYLSYWVDHALFGPDASGRHIVNVVLHLLNALLLFALWRRLGVTSIVALFASALFLVHPAVIESVAWVSSRKDLVSMLLLLVGLHSLLAVQTTSPKRFWIACCCFLLACLAKATALVFLPIIVLISWLKTDGEGEGRPTSISKSRLVILAALAITLTVIHLCVAIAQDTAAVEGAGTAARALSMLGVVTRYALLTVIPSGLTVHHDVPLEGAVGLYEVIGFLGMLALVVWAFRSRWKLSIPLLGAAWWLVSLAPFNNIAPRFSISMAERYLYIGTAGGALLIAAVVSALASRKPWAKGVAALAVILIASFVSRDRVKVWANSESLWRDAVEKSPNATLPRLQLGHALEERALNEHPEVAAETLDEVVELYRQGGRLSDNINERLQAHLKLSTLLVRTQRLVDGIACLDSIDRDLESSNIRLPRADRDSLIITRASALVAMGNSEGARQTLSRIGPLSPSQTDARNMIATLDILEATALLHQSKSAASQQRAVDQFEGGLNVYDAILRESPNHVKTRFDRARALHVATWRPDALIAVTNEVVALTREFPNDARSWSLRARVISDVDKTKAISHLGRAIALDPYQEGYYLRLSMRLKDLGKNKLAAQALLGGLQVLPDNPAISRQLAEFYLSFAHHYRNTKEPALALEAVERSLSMAGENADALVLRGELEETFAVDENSGAADRTRFWERARRSFEAAMKLQPDGTRAQSGLARYFKYRGYATLWEATKKIDGETAEAQQEREKSLRSAAMRDFSESLQLAETELEFAVIRGQLARYVEQLLVAGRTSLDSLEFKAARDCVIEGMALLPKSLNVWILKARIEAEDGFPKKARAAWQQALFLAPDSLQVLFELGKAEYTASRFNEANSHLKRFVELVGADENRASALKVELNVARRIIERCQETIR